MDHAYSQHYIGPKLRREKKRKATPKLIVIETLGKEVIDTSKEKLGLVYTKVKPVRSTTISAWRDSYM